MYSNIFSRLGSSVEMIADSFYALYRNPLNDYKLIGEILYRPDPIRVYLMALGYDEIHVHASHATYHVFRGFGVPKGTFPYPPALKAFLAASWCYPDLFGYAPRSGILAHSFVNACSILHPW